MKTFRGEGRAIQVTAPADVVSGQPLLVGILFGFCGAAAASGAKVALWTRGEYDGVIKKTGTAWTEGLLIYWDDVDKKLTHASTSGNTKVGVATAAAGSSAATGRVRLNPGA